MSLKSPFDFTELMKLYDPQQMAKLFSLDQFQSAFAPLSAKGVDVQALMNANKRHFEAMVAANKAAAEASKEFYQRQMAIFEQITGAANEFVESQSASSPDEFARKQTEIYSAAFQKSLSLMTELAETARKANEDAFSNMKDQIDAAIAEVKKS